VRLEFQTISAHPPLRLAELLGRISLLFDIASDAPPGKAVRSTVLAVELGRRGSATDEELRNSYWATLLGGLDGVGAELGLVRTEGVAFPPSCVPPAGAVAMMDEELRLALEDPGVFERFVALEPGPIEWVDEQRLDHVARALAAYSDGRCPVFAAHSTGVAALAERAAGELGLGPAETKALRLAALFHDIGRATVPNETWTRRGPLDWVEWERVRLGPHYTGRALAPLEALAHVADIAAAAHERMDGSGYPHRRSARSLSPAARVLSAAHTAFAMSEDRPHRPALSPEAIARELVQDVASGRLDAKAVDAVLSSLGLPHRVVRSNRNGLSGRELEVSQLLALGKSDREIGAALHISPRTVQVHVANILDKLGVRNRAGAAVWFVEHDVAH